MSDYSTTMEKILESFFASEAPLQLYAQLFTKATEAEDYQFDVELHRLRKKYKEQSKHSKRIGCLYAAHKLKATLTPEGIEVWCLYDKAKELVPKEVCMSFWNEVE